MRRIVLLISLVVVSLASGVASAKLPFFGLEVDPLHPSIGEPITLAMTCYGDRGHTQPESACFGDGGRMAWVHPLDTAGRLDRTDWIPVKGRANANGVTRGTITLDEPGSYDVLPIWRTWRDRPDGDGLPGVTRIEVGGSRRIVPLTFAAFGIAATGIALTARRQRMVRATS